MNTTPIEMLVATTKEQAMKGKIVCDDCGRQITIRESMDRGNLCGKCERILKLFHARVYLYVHGVTTERENERIKARLVRLQTKSQP